MGRWNKDIITWWPLPWSWCGDWPTSRPRYWFSRGCIRMRFSSTVFWLLMRVSGWLLPVGYWQTVGRKKACWLWPVSLAARFIFIRRIRLWDWRRLRTWRFCCVRPRCLRPFSRRHFIKKTVWPDGYWWALCWPFVGWGWLCSVGRRVWKSLLQAICWRYVLPSRGLAIVWSFVACPDVIRCRLSPGKCSFMGYLPFCRYLPYFLSGRIRPSCAVLKCGRTCCFWIW